MFPTVRALAAARPTTEVRLHVFPLPYNIGSWLPAQACVAAALLTNSSSAAVDCLAVLYSGDNQRTLKTAAMVNATTPALTAQLVHLLAGPLGIKAAALTSELTKTGPESGPPSYAATKADYKFGCARGVYATPSVFLNGVQLTGYDASAGGSHPEGQLAALNVSEWERVLG